MGAKPPLRIVDIGDAARHPGREVAPDLAQDRDDAAGHIFAGVVARAFDYRHRARISDRETLAGDAIEESLALDRTVKDGVADDDVGSRLTLRLVRLAHDDTAARKALADIIIRIAGQLQRHPAREESAEALPCLASEPNEQRVVGEACVAVATGDLSRQIGRAHV